MIMIESIDSKLSFNVESNRMSAIRSREKKKKLQIETQLVYEISESRNKQLRKRVRQMSLLRDELERLVMTCTTTDSSPIDADATCNLYYTAAPDTAQATVNATNTDATPASASLIHPISIANNSNSNDIDTDLEIARQIQELISTPLFQSAPNESVNNINEKKGQTKRKKNLMDQVSLVSNFNVPSLLFENKEERERVRDSKCKYPIQEEYRNNNNSNNKNRYRARKSSRFHEESDTKNASVSASLKEIYSEIEQGNSNIKSR